jgi:hypothetical protein
MNQQELEGMLEVAQQLHVTMVTDVYGDTGVPALRKLLIAINHLYKRVAPEIHRGTIIVVKTISDAPLHLETAPVTILSLDNLPPLRKETIVIQVFENGSFALWQLASVDPQSLAVDAIVYSFHQGIEKFHANDKRSTLIKLSPAFASNFGIPTFHDLRSAIENYRSLMARHSSCKILQTIWFDRNRIFLRVRPESIMRDSLSQFLKGVVGTEAEVRPEQNMDERHPVDIKVEWFMSRKIAIIEIKWLGCSRDVEHITTEYSEPRAREGAEQLSGYLDQNALQAPTHNTRGYLVVFDARRANISENTTTVDGANGLWFEDKEIRYDPEFHLIRQDFETPVRIFLEPVCQS